MSAAATNQNNQPNSLNSTTDLQMLLPKCLEMIGNGTKSAELRVAYDAPTNQTTFQYSLIWEDVSQGSEEKYRVAITEASKMMLALKAKQLNKSDGIIRDKNTGENSKKTKEPTMEKQDYEIPFPPDLRTHSEQREKSQVSSCSASSDSSSSITSDASESAKTIKKAYSSSSSKNDNSKMKPIGCLDELQKVSVKVIVIDTPNFRGKLRPTSRIESTMSTRVKSILVKVLREHYEGLPIEKLIKSAGVLFAFHGKNGAQKLRRIRHSDIETVMMCNLPTLRDSVVLILDLIRYIEKGKKIPIQIDIDEQ